MNEIFKLVLSLSLSGSLLALVLFLLKPLYKNGLSKTWQYYIFLIVIFRFILPFGIEKNYTLLEYQQKSSPIINEEMITEVNQNINSVSVQANQNIEEIFESPDSNMKHHVVSKNNNMKHLVNYIWIIWLIPAIFLLLKKIILYYRFIHLNRDSSIFISENQMFDFYLEVCKEMDIKYIPKLAVNKDIDSPMLIGIIKPIITLNDNIVSGELEYILRHELIHYKRRDILYKWLVEIMVCLHWYNPIVYWVRKEINRNCELSCDEIVIKNLDREGKFVYGDILLNNINLNINTHNKVTSLTLSEDTNLIKERLESIMRYHKKSKVIIVISAIFALFILFGAASMGVYAVDMRNDESPNNDIKYSNIKLDIDVNEFNKKIQVTADISGKEIRTVELISPDGTSVRKYYVNEDGFMENSSKEHLILKNKKIMISDIAEIGTWQVVAIPDDKISLSAKLIEKDMFTFNDINKYDYSKTYEQTLYDIENGYVFYMDKLLSKAAIHKEMMGANVDFYVSHDNILDIDIELENLFRGSKEGWIMPNHPFIKFEIYDPDGNTVYSFHKKDRKIEATTNIREELEIYPGLWRYHISFAYKTAGWNLSKAKISAKYRTIYDEDIQSLKENKLNILPEKDNSIAFSSNNIINEHQTQKKQSVVYEKTELRYYEGETGHPYIYDVITNNTSKKIIGNQYGMLAFDKEGNPLKIDWWSGSTSYNPSFYYFNHRGSTEIAPNEIYDLDIIEEKGGWSLNLFGLDPEVERIAYVLYCDKEITFGDGTVWENPDFETWRQTYEGKIIDVEVLESYYPYKHIIEF